jgi:hypothetical protein
LSWSTDKVSSLAKTQIGTRGSGRKIWGLSGRVFETFRVQDTSDVFNIDTIIVRRDAFDIAGHFDEGLATMEHHDHRLAFHFPFIFINGAVTKGHVSRQG